MSLDRVKRLLLQPENIRLEFKESRADLPANLFETICAMLNREGGDILLGVADDGTVQGVDASRIEIIKTNLVSLSNNPNKLDPPFILFPQVYELDGKSIIHIQVPSSSQMHKSAGVVFDRSNDGDFRVTQPQQIAEIYNRKRTHYTEGIIYPAVRFEDFKAELFPKIRNLISSNNANHPWLSVNDISMLQMAGLWKRDPQTGQEGYTLAAVLLLGKDEVIQSALPHYKIDALVRKVDMARYDDREYIQTNLVDAYDQLMAFTAKHLPDKFYMEGDQRVSLRTKIFREIIANLIVHREYTNARPATFIIYKDRVETENANNPHGEGPIDPNNFAPFPKNPSIAKFFVQLGRVDELGSGVLNVNRYLEHYSPGKKPVFSEGITFKTSLPLDEGLIDTANAPTDTANDAIVTAKAITDTVTSALGGAAKKPVRERLTRILQLLYEKPGLQSHDIAAKLDVSDSAVRRDIQRVSALVEFKGPSKNGGYYLTNEAQKQIETRKLSNPK